MVLTLQSSKDPYSALFTLKIYQKMKMTTKVTMDYLLWVDLLSHLSFTFTKHAIFTTHAIVTHKYVTS